jgi:hypothetical protein
MAAHATPGPGSPGMWHHEGGLLRQGKPQGKAGPPPCWPRQDSADALRGPDAQSYERETGEDGNARESQGETGTRGQGGGTVPRAVRAMLPQP